MADRRKFNIKREKVIYTEGWRVEGRDNPVTPQYTSSRIWRKVENNNVGNKRCEVIYKRMWYILEDEK